MDYVILTICLICYAIMTAGMWQLFEKAGLPGWYAVIPVCNTWFLFSISKRNSWGVAYFVGLILYIIAFLVTWYLSMWLVVAFFGAVFSVDLGWQHVSSLGWTSYVIYGCLYAGIALRIVSRGVCAMSLVKQMKCPRAFWWGVWLLPMVFLPLLGCKKEYTWKYKQITHPAATRTSVMMVM
ncbi:MAG: hypothetical protein IJZ68_06440 [Bacteroidaceae bacterium]|nr:hypothetical protein [Bacteroidaceae bacterium]